MIENELNSEKIGVITGFCITNQKGGYKLKSQSGTVPKDNKNFERNISKEVLGDPQIVSTFKTSIKGLKNVACTNDRKLWVSNDEVSIQLLQYDTNVNVSHLSFEGINSHAIVQNVTADKGQKSIAVTGKGDLLFGKVLSNKINIFTKHKTDELVNLNSWSLLSLCITATDGLLVCMTDTKGYSCRVVRFEGSDERQIIQYDRKGKRLFALGKGRKWVKENRNGDVCVADYDGKAVVVTDKTGTLRFRYNEGLCPVGVVTDTQAQLIVFYPGILIHIIDRDGHFLHCFKHCLPSWTEEHGWDVDSEDCLYLAEVNGNVKKIRYMKQLHE